MRDRLIINCGNRKILKKRSFKDILKSNNRLIRICGVHDALNAYIAEECGFDGVWISSFEVHASARLPDADILTVSDYSNVCNKIADRIEIPILMDGDAGGGSPINTIRMVREYEKNGALGLCIEDNKYPKRCSFYAGVKRELEDPGIHATKIRAAKDNSIDKDFFVVARTEALIVGYGVEEAIRRANIYADSGADAILIHHKGSDPSDVFRFSELFKGRLPLVSVPTTYNSVTEAELLNNGFSIFIYANCGIRATIKVMGQHRV